MNAGISKLACLGTLVVAAIIPDVEAGTLTVRRPVGYAGSTGGGEYNVTPSDALLLSSYSPKTLLEIDGIRGFESFGLESKQTISEGISYSYSQNQSSVRGGETPEQRGRRPGDNTPTDSLSRGSAWLYAQFSDGILPGYNYTPGPGREASATSLQIALWALENETDTNGNPWDTQMGGNTFFDAAVGRFGSLADARLDNNGLFGVEVMIVSTGAAATLELWQDLLVRTGGGAAVRTPDGGSAVALLCAGWSVLTLLRRRSCPSGISGSPQN